MSCVSAWLRAPWLRERGEVLRGAELSVWGEQSVVLNSTAQ